jgi:hypothetical protein
MAHDFDDLIAELDAAKANLARSVKRCRTFLGERKLPPVTIDDPATERSAFGWTATKNP